MASLLRRKRILVSRSAWMPVGAVVGIRIRVRLMVFDGHWRGQEQVEVGPVRGGRSLCRRLEHDQEHSSEVVTFIDGTKRGAELAEQAWWKTCGETMLGSTENSTSKWVDDG